MLEPRPQEKGAPALKDASEAVFFSSLACLWVWRWAWYGSYQVRGVRGKEVGDDGAGGGEEEAGI